MDLTVGYLKFVNLNIKSSKIHKVRGYFGKEYIDYDILHNHLSSTEKNVFLYRYPRIQFKLIINILGIVAIEKDALNVVKKIFISSTKKISVEKSDILNLSKEIEFQNIDIGVSSTSFVYKFNSPWIALNQKNYKSYLDLEDEKAKTEKLNSIMIQNIISFCKGVGYTIPKEHQIIVTSDLKAVKVTLKGQRVLGFLGYFKVNFKLFDYLGLGKSSSRGYGVIKKVL